MAQDAPLNISISLENLDIVIEALGSLPAQRAGVLYADLVRGRIEYVNNLNNPQPEPAPTPLPTIDPSTLPPGVTEADIQAAMQRAISDVPYTESPGTNAH